jgi:pimeloyl-ACP methyl ester carboxylesterase
MSQPSESYIFHRNVPIEPADKHSNQRVILMDICLPTKGKRFTPIIFAHGFKGFKDWGHFDYMSEYFAQQGLACIKFNFSHNGVTVDDPSDISDFEVFGHNNYSIEIEDLKRVMDYLEKCEWKEFLALGNIHVVGHSRGGAIGFLTSLQDARIRKLVMWASPFDLGKSFRSESIEKWNTLGKVDVVNGRTKEVYPLYRQFYDDFVKNKPHLDIPRKCHECKIPLLLLHAKDDQVVPIEDARAYYEHIPHAILIELDKGGHTFGASHPFDPETCDTLDVIEEVLENTVEFVLDEFTYF